MTARSGIGDAPQHEKDARVVTGPGPLSLHLKGGLHADLGIQ